MGSESALRDTPGKDIPAVFPVQADENLSQFAIARSDLDSAWSPCLSHARISGSLRPTL